MRTGASEAESSFLFDIVLFHYYLSQLPLVIYRCSRGLVRQAVTSAHALLNSAQTVPPRFSVLSSCLV